MLLRRRRKGRDKLDVIVELGRRSDDPSARMNRITAWLDARPDVQNWRTGDEFNIWHGNFQDIDIYVRIYDDRNDAPTIKPIPI